MAESFLFNSFFFDRDGQQSQEHVQADRHSRSGGGGARDEAPLLGTSTQGEQVIQRCKSKLYDSLFSIIGPVQYLYIYYCGL